MPNVENNCCEFNPVNELFACGNSEGVVECWDPRQPRQAGLLNCSLDSLFESDSVERKCAVTALKFRDGLNLAVGTSTGHVSRICFFVSNETSSNCTCRFYYMILDRVDRCL